MKDERTNSHIEKCRVLAFILVFSIIFTTFYGCGEKDKDGDKTTLSSAATTITKDDGTSSADSTSTSSSATGSSGSTTKKSTSKTTTKSSGTSKKTTQAATKAPTTASAPKSNTYYAPIVYTNTASGTATIPASDGSGVIDYSNASSGYVMAKYTGSYAAVKFGVTGPNGVEHYYHVFSRGGYVSAPLSSGSGTYRLRLLGSDGTSNSYYLIVGDSINVSLSSSTAPFLRPNLNSDYTSSTACVQQAANLTRGCDTDIQKVEAIYNYVVSNFSYDYGKASRVAKSAYAPDLNAVWSSKSGICFDYAATMTAMLRTQGIPTKHIAGYVNGGTYHAWISTFIRGSGWVDGIIYFDGSSWKLMDPTFASTGGNNCDWSQKSSYQTAYTY